MVQFRFLSGNTPFGVGENGCYAEQGLNMPIDTLCQAIRNKHLVQFYYTGDKEHGTRIVEPFMVAYNKAEHLALSAWYLSGVSQSEIGQWWREYLLSEMTQIIELEQQFSGVRPGYKPDGGKSFHNVQCAI
jgi:predicted DNA-binding transcriptional regulator YafY